jgi:hypothetical protein
LSFHLRDMLLLADDYLTVVPACMLRVFNAKRLTVKALPIDLGIGARPVALFTLRKPHLEPGHGSLPGAFARRWHRGIRSLTHAGRAVCHGA